MASIIVGMRMRPMVGHEQGQKPCVDINGKDVSVIVDNLNEHDRSQHPNVGPWRFDVAMDSSDSSSSSFVSNDQCYELMGRPLVVQVLQGYNSCLFCYGQTGTGKTATIMGYPGLGPGLLPRMLEDLMGEAEKMRQQGCTVSCKVQMLEVYNEDIHDLLLDKQKWKDAKVKTRVLPKGVDVAGATEREVKSLAECEQILKEGDERKTVFPTKMNPGSSRGHMVFKLSLDKAGGPDGTKLHCEVYFADLAGHENIKQTAVTGDRLTELKHINSSLMYLQRAIHSLATASSKKGGNKDKVNFSVFRNSELTLLLANGLTGNSKAAVIVTLSPAAQHFETSLSSIEFGLEVKGIKLDVHSTVTIDPAAQMKKLEAEVASLKAQLAAALDGKPPPPPLISPGDEKPGDKKNSLRMSEKNSMKTSESMAMSVKPMSQENEELQREIIELKHENVRLRNRMRAVEAGEYDPTAKPSACRRLCYALGCQSKAHE